MALVSAVILFRWALSGFPTFLSCAGWIQVVSVICANCLGEFWVGGRGLGFRACGGKAAGSRMVPHRVIDEMSVFFSHRVIAEMSGFL